MQPPSPQARAFLARRPRRLWLGLAMGLAAGALLAAFILALLSGWWVQGNVLANASLPVLARASAATLLVAALSTPVLGLGLAWGHHHGRLTPARSLAWFALPWVLGSAAVAGGTWAALAPFAGYLCAAFALQALLSWALFAFVAYPPYPVASRAPAA